jgi:alpha-1,3-mannosyl-glycoprotein beta-1,2-N-acetylglucosaminyltransferase
MIVPLSGLRLEIGHRHARGMKASDATTLQPLQLPSKQHAVTPCHHMNIHSTRPYNNNYNITSPFSRTIKSAPSANSKPSWLSRNFIYKLIATCLILVILLYIYGLISYSVTVAANPSTGTSSEYSFWRRLTVRTSPADTALQEAIELLDESALNQAIQGAEATQPAPHTSKLLKAAIYLRQKLSEDAATRSNLSKKLVGSDLEKGAREEGPEEIKLEKKKIEESRMQKPAEQEPGPAVLPNAFSSTGSATSARPDGLSLPKDWRLLHQKITNSPEKAAYFPLIPWHIKSAPSELATLLPSLPAAGFSYPLEGEGEALAQRRHEEIVKLYAKYPPHSFPIGVVACNRPAALNLTLLSLRNVRGIDFPGQITVYQDGNHEEVANLVKFYGVLLVQNLENPNHLEGAVRISRHYKYTLSHLFSSHPSPYVIVAEDDMLFSPDFLLFFTQTAPLMDVDKSIYCISSWNDNGFAGRSWDPRELYRTEFFIGLGWLVSRELFKGEWEKIWPYQHWDHFLREEQQRRGRHCIFPEIPRNYNIGKLGTHSDDLLFTQYFEKIVYNRQESVFLGDLTRLLRDNYEKSVESEILSAKLVQNLTELSSSTNSTLKLYYRVDRSQVELDLENNWENSMAVFFGLWHSIPIRNDYKGAVSFRMGRNNKVFLVRSDSHYFQMESSKNGRTLPLIRLFEAKDFLLDKLGPKMTVVVAAEAHSCGKACYLRGQSCAKLALHLINNCATLEQNFSCKKCETQANGQDHPAIVTQRNHQNEGVCMVNARAAAVKCSGQHAATTRLCVCQDIRN